jgi:hypothetical protein
MAALPRQPSTRSRAFQVELSGAEGHNEADKRYNEQGKQPRCPGGHARQCRRRSAQGERPAQQEGRLPRQVGRALDAWSAGRGAGRFRGRRRTDGGRWRVPAGDG